MAHGYKPKTVESYLDWIYRFMAYHGTKAPGALGSEAVSAFLDFLVLEKGSSAASQKQARYALGLLYRLVLKQPLEKLNFHAAPDSKVAPHVLSPEVVRQVLDPLPKTPRLMAYLLYGCGLRLHECVRLRIRDVDFEGKGILLRDERGDIVRRTVLPAMLEMGLKSQMEEVRGRYNHNLMLLDFEGVELPSEMGEGKAQCALAFEWQYLFPSRQLTLKALNDGWLQGHVSESSLQKMVKGAFREAGIETGASCDTLRHSFAAHLLAAGHPVTTVQRLMGHKRRRSTRRYQVSSQNGLVLKSPLDG